MNIRETPESSEDGSITEKNWLLYRGITSLLRCDEAEVVGGIARYVISQYQILQTGAAFVERRRETPIAAVAAFLGAVTRFLEIRQSDHHGSGIVWTARLDNERRAIAPLLSSLSAMSATELTFHRRPNAAAVTALFRGLLPKRRQILRLARVLLNRKEKFFKILRVAEMIGYYAHYLHVFRQNDFSLAVMSSHSNPHGIAFNLAARRCGVPVVLVTHGMPVRPIARLPYDLAIVHCEAARRRYVADGSRLDRALVHGRRQDYLPMSANPLPDRVTVGVFLCKDVNEECLIDLTKRLLDEPRVGQILLRPHPKNLWRGFADWIESLNDPRVQSSAAERAALDLQSVDVVCGGNSSVLIEAVTSGRPSVFVAGLDYGPPDLHGLVADGLIYPFDEQIGLDFVALLDFYRRPEWHQILEDYANVNENESDVILKAQVIMGKLIERSKTVKKRESSNRVI